MGNASLTQTKYLVTDSADPMGRDGGLYLRLPINGRTAFLRLDQTVSIPLANAPSYLDVIPASAVHGVDRTAGTVEIYEGGPHLLDDMFLLHDSAFSTSASLPIQPPILYVTVAADVPSGEVAKPTLGKLARGCLIVSSEELTKRTSSGDWVEFEAPAFVSYGKNLSALAGVAIAKSYRPASGMGLSSMLSGMAEIMKDVGAEFQLAAIRTCVTFHLQKDAPLAQDQLEAILETYIAVQHHEAKEITDLMERYSAAEIAEKAGALQSGFYEIPLVQKNAEFGELFKRIGLQRPLFDYALFTGAMRSRKNVENEPNAVASREATVRNLELKFDKVRDIVRASDPRPV